MDRGVSRTLPSPANDDSLSSALEAISVSTELIGEELKPHLDILLTAALERQKGVAEQVVRSGILPTLAQALRRKSSLTLHSAKLVAELAREAPVRELCFEAGIVSALLTLLLSQDQDLLLHVCRAIGRICYESSLQQERCVRLGAVPRLVAILLAYGESDAMLASCLLALCNLAGMGEEDCSCLRWQRAGHSAADGEIVFHGTSRQLFSFGSPVTVVRLQRWSKNQHMVTVEAVQRCSAVLWGVQDGRRTSRRFPFSPLGGCPRIYKVIKCTVRNIPRNRGLKSAVFHTLL